MTEQNEQLNESTTQWVHKHGSHNITVGWVDKGEERQCWMQCEDCEEGHLVQTEPIPQEQTLPKTVDTMTLEEVVAEIDDMSNLGDRIYSVMDRAVEKAPQFEGSAWELPEVKRYSDLCMRVSAFLKGAGLR